MTLDEALARLLYKPAVLAEFLRRGPGVLGLDAEDAAAIGAIDREQLLRTAERIRGEILRRPQRGCGALVDRFARTIVAYGGGEPGLDRLAGEFLDSREFDAYREVPFAGAGCSLEEAFFRFAEARAIGAAAEREQEFLAAIVRALVMEPDPDFVVPAEVRRAPGGWFAVRVRGEPTLFAALGGRLVSGALTPFLAELLVSDDAPAEVAARHAVAEPALAAALAQLVALGLRVDATSAP